MQHAGLVVGRIRIAGSAAGSMSSSASALQPRRHAGARRGALGQLERQPPGAPTAARPTATRAMRSRRADGTPRPGSRAADRDGSGLRAGGQRQGCHAPGGVNVTVGCAAGAVAPADGAAPAPLCAAGAEPAPVFVAAFESRAVVVVGVAAIVTRYRRNARRTDRAGDRRSSGARFHARCGRRVAPMAPRPRGTGAPRWSRARARSRCRSSRAR